MGGQQWPYQIRCNWEKVKHENRHPQRQPTLEILGENSGMSGAWTAC